MEKWQFIYLGCLPAKSSPNDFKPVTKLIKHIKKLIKHITKLTTKGTIDENFFATTNMTRHDGMSSCSI
jgi:hypothetical protein